MSHLHDWVTKPAVVNPATKVAEVGADFPGQRVFAVVCATCKRADLAYDTYEDAQERLQVLRRAALVNAYNGMG